MSLRVKVDGTDRVFAGHPGDDLLEVFQSNGEPIATSCGGVATCGLCRVTIVSGGASLVPIKAHEIVHLGNVAKIVGLRLACQAELRTDAAEDAEIVVRIPVAPDVEERKRRKAERARVDARTKPSDAHPGGPPRIEWRLHRLSTPEDGKEGKGGT